MLAKNVCPFVLVMMLFSLTFVNVHSSSNEDLHQWMSAFDTAIKEHREKAQSRRSIREQLNPVSLSHDNHLTSRDQVVKSGVQLCVCQ